MAHYPNGSPSASPTASLDSATLLVVVTKDEVRIQRLALTERDDAAGRRLLAAVRPGIDAVAAAVRRLAGAR